MRVNKGNSRLESLKYRRQLKPDGEVAWEEISRGVAVGYRNGWWHRRIRAHGRYVKKRVARADDDTTADGKMVLDYKQAMKAALKASDAMDEDEEPSAELATYTVRHAVESYLEWFAVENKSLDKTQSAIKLHILPKLGDSLVVDLTAKQIRRWHHRIARSKPRLRSTPLVPRYRDVQNAPEEESVRMRKSTANRVLTILKALLNRAAKENGFNIPRPWRDVDPFKDVERARTRFLSEHEAKRLLNASDKDFRDIVHGALLTGARWGSLCAIRCEDFNPESETVYIRHAKTEASQKHVPLTDEGMALFDRLTAGKRGSDFVFTKTDCTPWRRSEQTRRMDAACARAKIVPKVTFHNLKDTFVSHLVRRGVAFKFISDVAGTSVRTLEKYYSHLAESDVRDVLVANAMKLSDEPAKVRRMR